MPLATENLIQQNSGSFFAASGNATLSVATTAGNTVILVLGQNAGLVDPAGFTLVKKGAIVAPHAGVYWKNTAGGETSFAIAPSGGSRLVDWVVLEVEGLDQTDPVDSIPSGSVSTGTGATLSTGTTPVSGTFDGLVLALHTCLDTTSTTPGTWSDHTGGLTETQEVGGNDGVSTSLGLSVSWAVPALSLAAWSSTATKTAPVGQASTATIVVFSAANAKRAADVLVCAGFEFGTTAGIATGNLGAGIFDAVAGSPAVVSTSPRSGTYCLELSASAAIENLLWAHNGALFLGRTGRLPLRLSIYFPTSLPSGDTVLYRLEPAVTAADAVVVRYVSASQKIGVKVAGGTEVLSDATVAANTWINTDQRIDSRTTSHVFDWRVTYSDGTDPVVQTSATATGTSSNEQYGLRLGWTTNTTATVRYDDVVVGDHLGNYPLGDNRVVPITVDPAGTLTVNGVTTNWNTFSSNGTMAAWNATTARDAIDDLPPTIGGTADGFAQVANSTSAYVEIPLTTYNAAANGGAIRGVRALLCGWAASATAASFGLRAYDGVGEITLKTATDFNFDNSTTSPAWLCDMVRASSVRQDWTQAKLDALAFRVGFSGDTSPNVGLHFIMGEVAIRIGELYEVTYIDPGFYVHFRQDPDSNGIIAMIVTTPTGTRGATLDWSILGTPQTPVYVNPDSVHEETIGATDVATITSMTLTPDP